MWLACRCETGSVCAAAAAVVVCTVKLHSLIADIDADAVAGSFFVCSDLVCAY